MPEPSGYILTEIWKARDSWLALSTDDRAAFFEERVGPLLMRMIGDGAEILACVVNDNTGSERLDYRYMAVWRLPDKTLSDRLEAEAKAAGFLEYFEQVNVSGEDISPQALNGDMINFEA